MSNKGATTRRIRRRAAEWRPQTRPERPDIAARLAEHLEEAARATYSRPPLSGEALVWNQLRHMSDAATALQRTRHASRGDHWHRRNQPGAIGGVRLAREGMAALLAALETYSGTPAECGRNAVHVGDLVEHSGALHRVAGRHACGALLLLEGGGQIDMRDDDAATVRALRPADAKQYAEEVEARAKAERDRLRDHYESTMLQFGMDYAAAWERRDGAAMQAAVDACRAAWGELAGKGYGTARQSITHRAFMIREGKPPVYPRDLGRAWRRSNGFAHHVSLERQLLERLAWWRSLPGARPDDRRDVVTVKDWRGRRLRVSGPALRGERWGDWIPRVNAAGLATNRTGQILAREIVAIA